MSTGHRLFLTVAILSALIWSERQVGAADTGSIVPLPSAVKAQLEKYLGPGVVGAPIASPPLMAAADYLPPKGATLNYRVVEEGEPARTETHKVEDTTDAQFARGCAMRRIRWALSTSRNQRMAAPRSWVRRIATTRSCRASRLGSR